MGAKILWHSNAPWANTGYGQQTATFAPRIRDLGYDVGISAFWGLAGSPLEWNGMPVYPADEKWGNLTLPALAKDHGGDGCLVITLMDVWVLTSPALENVNLASWVPVDHDPAPPRVIEFFRRTGARPVAMSRFGHRKLTEAGLDPLYVPHGIDTNVFRPMPDAARDLRGVFDIPEDAFVIGMVAANKGIMPPRKAFPQVFQAFSELRKRHDDAILFLHTELAGQHEGMNLGALAQVCGIPSEAIRYTPQWSYEKGVPQEHLAAIYNMFDVLANPSYGEGFGVPIVEAQACGVPVIVTDCTAMTELCGSGWLVEGERWYNATQGSFYTCPSVADIIEAMESARVAKVPPARAREFALEYDADRVLTEFWKPALERLMEPRPKTLKPLPDMEAA